MIVLSVLMLILLQKPIFRLCEYTTIGNQIWFGDKVSHITDKIKSSRISTVLTNISYSKLFVCYPCHCWWLSFIAGSTLACIVCYDVWQYLAYTLFITTPISLLGYLHRLGYDGKTQN